MIGSRNLHFNKLDWKILEYSNADGSYQFEEAVNFPFILSIQPEDGASLRFYLLELFPSLDSIFTRFWEIKGIILCGLTKWTHHLFDLSLAVSFQSLPHGLSITLGSKSFSHLVFTRTQGMAKKEAVAEYTANKTSEGKGVPWGPHTPAMG